ncbi:ABC transporter substrate-binding protein [Siccirubricoccus sp. KC 17139]|uniref:ABC transporter substrate-binding protein n=1 Tax=Siccirubricoccus soli TaxID=2899147 RepID=A0ABT1D7Y5_9PROT|nr:ABC transporter substrate-binding protein [Siccirubricoccus soli]MCO6418042.1 ABC transporter substrate-binding protein [Siccirubricoccus soli]MCP2684177.1 ABC transporter substrate-binding protein [Siccirubricoccus soli]
MRLTRRAAFGAAASLLSVPALRAQPAEPIRIGVLTDLSGPYRDVTGPTSVACVRQAVEEFTAQNPEIRVEIITADHQNKPDVGINTVRQWFDQRGVDMVTDVGNSAIALGINPVCVEKDRIHLNASAGTSDLTGRGCTPNSIHWSYDTWCLSNTSGTALTKMGGDSWYFITADYAFGHAIERDTTRFIEAAGGKLLGASRYPFPQTTDFSAFLLQAQASRAKVLGLAMAGDDVLNCVKQAQEFGLTRNTRLAAIIGSITAVISAGLPTMQGMYIAETFWWDLNERTRGFTQRVRQKLPANVWPNYVHAANYSGVLHYLKAVKAMGVPAAKASGRAVVAQMKRMPTDDDAFGPGLIREDGRKLHPSFLLQVKKPGEDRYPGDVYTLAATVPAEEAFRPISEGGCPMVRG